MTGSEATTIDANRDAAKTLAILGGFFCIAAAAVYFISIDWRPGFPHDGSTLVVGRDFLNFWMYGRATAMADPGRWYDVAAYQAAVASFLGPGYPPVIWSYPPTVMLIAAPFGQIGYFPALLTWTLLGLAILLPVAARRLADRHALIALMVSPAAVFCLISGQSSLITTAMLIGIFGLLDRRPLVAGLLLGLLTLKPQLGILFPVMLIASGRWRVIATATITALMIVALTTAFFGIQVWIDFVTQGLPTQKMLLTDPQGAETFYPTIFMNLRGVGTPYNVAMAVQAVFACVAAAVIAWAYRRRADADADLLFALFLSCSIAAVPYLLVYDTLALSFAVLALLAARKLDTRGCWLARFIYWLPLLQIGLGTVHVPGPALIAPAFALGAVLQLMRSARYGDDPDRERVKSVASRLA